jgi:tetratricopeptide (TPR) repeat protein
MLLGFSNLSSASKAEFKDRFMKAYNLIVVDNYPAALKILKELGQESPDNANLKSMMGYCYLKTGNTYKEAIDCYTQLNFPDDYTAAYKDGNEKELLAPLEALLYLGEAYHMNYEFEKALEPTRNIVRW